MGAKGDRSILKRLMRLALATTLLLAVALHSTSGYAPTTGDIPKLEREADGYAEKGNWSRAVKIYKDLLDSAREAGDERRQLTLSVKVAEVQTHRGNFPDALNLYDEALALAEKLGDDRKTLETLIAQARVFQVSDDESTAASKYEEALELADTVGDSRAATLCHVSLGKHYSRKAQHEAVYKLAASHLGDAETIAKGLEDDELQVEALIARARLAIARREFPAARSALGAASRISTQSALKLHQAETLLYTGYLLLLQKEPDPEKALEQFNIAAKAYGGIKQSESYMSCLYGMAKCFDLLGKSDDSLQAYRNTIKIFESRKKIVSPDTGNALPGEVTADVYGEITELLIEMGQEEQASEYLDRTNLNTFSSQFESADAELLTEQEQQLVARDKALRARTVAIENALSAEQAQSRQNARLIKSLLLSHKATQKEYRVFIHQLFDKHPELASIVTVKPVEFRDVQTLLSDEMVLLQYLMGKDALYIFCVTRDELEHRTVDVSRRELEKATADLRRFVDNPSLARDLGPLKTETFEPESGEKKAIQSVAEMKQASTALYGYLVKPVESLLFGRYTIGIIPNGRLHYIPFQILGKAKEGQFDLLVDRYSIYHLNSLGAIEIAAGSSRSEFDGGLRILAFGNADGSLPLAEQEVEMLERIIPGTRVYVGKQATKKRLMDEAPGHNVLHFATHAVLDERNVTNSHVQLAPTTGSDDGRLTLEEIWGLDLGGCDLVTLSACETAIGEVSAGDEIVTTAKAFLYARARSVVASLWQVDDLATTIIMGDFYRNLKTKSKAEALRQAQLSARNNPKYANPFYWSPFILIGAPG